MDVRDRSRSPRVSAASQDAQQADDVQPAESPEPSITVRVVYATSGNELCMLAAKESWDVQTLKAAIAEATGIPDPEQRLLVHTMELAKDKMIVDIEHEGEILVVAFVHVDPSYVARLRWTRMESRSIPGVFYYFNTETGESRWSLLSLG